MAVLPANERPSSWGVGGWLPWRTSWAWGWGTAESGPGTASARRFSRWPSRGSLWRSTAMLSGARGEDCHLPSSLVGPAQKPQPAEPARGIPRAGPTAPDASLAPRLPPGPGRRGSAGSRAWPQPHAQRPTPRRPLPGSLRPPAAASAPAGPSCGWALCQAPGMQRSSGLPRPGARTGTEPDSRGLSSEGLGLVGARGAGER